MRIEIYGTRSHPDVQQFLTALVTQCATLGIQLDTTDTTTGPEADLSLVFAHATSTWTAPEQEKLKDLKARGHLFLPVIDTAPDAVGLPTAIATINAFKIQDMGPAAWVDSLVDETLAITWLKRRTRKVFISYRRPDSSPIAAQLFDRFSELGYEVFLDDASIERGTDFQRELKWWLNDTDLMLLLCSPRFADSPWCMEEINFAQAHTIGIAALQWPRQVYDPGATVEFEHQLGWKEPVLLQATMDDQTLPLELGFFEGVDGDKPDPDPRLPSRKLTAAAVEKVLALCARNRARAIRARLNELLPLVKDTITRNKANKDLTQTFGDLTYKDENDKDCFVRVLPFRPGPEQLYQANLDGKGKFLAVCAYAESDLTDPRAKALRWLAQKQNAPAQATDPNNALWGFCGDARL